MLGPWPARGDQRLQLDISLHHVLLPFPERADPADPGLLSRRRNQTTGRRWLNSGQSRVLLGLDSHRA